MAGRPDKASSASSRREPAGEQGGHRSGSKGASAPAPSAAAAAAAAAASAARAEAEAAELDQLAAGDAAPDCSPSSTAEAEKLPRVELRALKMAVPAKNLISCYLLGPVLLGECRAERLCVPWLNLILLVADIMVFSGHLFLAIKRRAYREHVPTYNFYILLVFWSLWNLYSHPLCRQHMVDLFVTPPEIHVTINVAAIAVCSSAIMPPPTMRHLVGLVTCEFLISLVLSSIEVLNFHMDNGWLAAVRLDIVMFNVAILLIGSTIIIGTMTVEKDIKSLAHEMETRLGPAGSFEDDLERRKRAVLTALCDAVLTTNASFQITSSDDGADRLFRKPMLNEMLTDYFKDQAEQERFLAAVKKQFPEDDTAGEGPKRMRVSMRDDHDEVFEADIVVSDANTDRNGKVTKYMVGMHVRGEFRARALDTAKRPRGADRRHAAVGNEGDRDGRDSKKDRGEAGDERNHAHMYEELGHELLAAFDAVLLPPHELAAAAARKPATAPCAEGGGGGAAAASPTAPDGQPRFFLRRASYEVFRRRTPPLGARGGDRHVDLRRLSLPEPAVAGLV